MATLKEFEEALREAGMSNALAILDALKKRDRETRSVAPARRVVGRKMTAELARSILELHATTGMTQQEIAFRLGVNQGRVNEVIKRGKWLSADPKAPEMVSRDKAMARLDRRAKARRVERVAREVPAPAPAPPSGPAVARLRPASELPLGRAAPPRPARAEQPAPLPIRRPAAAPGAAIVSAQLAFLDL